MLDHQQVVERDDGRFEIGLVDPVGPFETREFAMSVAHAASAAKTQISRSRGLPIRSWRLG
jgi:hypothetical protein